MEVGRVGLPDIWRYHYGGKRTRMGGLCPLRSGKENVIISAFFEMQNNKALQYPNCPKKPPPNYT